MFTLELIYLQREDGRRETVRSSYVPQIGSSIYGYLNYEYKVTNVYGSTTDDGTLSDTISVDLVIED